MKLKIIIIAFFLSHAFLMYGQSDNEQLLLGILQSETNFHENVLQYHEKVLELANQNNKKSDVATTLFYMANAETKLKPA